MSERIEIIRRLNEAMNGGDRDQLAALLAPDAEWQLVGFLLDQARLLHGPEEVADYLDVLRREFEGARIELGELREVGARVVGELRVSGRGAQTGVEGSFSLAVVWDVRGGRVLRAENFLDMEEALAAIRA